MCGIAGVFLPGSAADYGDSMQRALFAMMRRGPNGRGIESVREQNTELLLGHTRLSIIDLSHGGRQPMRSSDGRFVLVFNGEIYNYRELRVDLERLGVDFRSQSDTEVLLQAWTVWGEACLPKLTGMFAFAVYDREKGELTCVRDAFGIKPFFYCWDGDTFVFASELPAIKALRTRPAQLNLQRSYDYLAWGDYDSTEQTFLDGVFHLLPGHVLRITMGGARGQPARWWTPRVEAVEPISFDDAADTFRSMFLDNVRLHLRSDVAIGAALSGGLDSSAIVAAMRHLEPDLPIHTFSYIARGSQLSEEVWVDQITAGVNAVAHKVEVSAFELAADIEDMILAQGEPFGSTSIYAQYRVFKSARDHGVTVTLDGQGADELLAGYNGYPEKRIHSLLDEHRYFDAGKFVRAWSSWPNRRFAYGAKSAIANVLDGPVYRRMRKLWRHPAKNAWLDVDGLTDRGVQTSMPLHPSPYEMRGRRLMSELAFSLTQRGLPALLRHGDRNSMRFSVESRVPFLTTSMADLLLGLPEHYLISAQGQTKHVMRAALRGIVPDAVLNRRDKVGFETPERQWLAQLAPQARQWLGDGPRIDFIHRQS